jgi:methyl-branched lipid omega-hydroxylase
MVWISRRLAGRDVGPSHCRDSVEEIRALMAVEPRLEIGSSAFWRRPLAERMRDFAHLRATERLPQSSIGNIFTGDRDEFFAVLRFEDVLEISRNPKVFCSGRGSNTVQDMPTDLSEYFGSFITMDDPRHARQRRIVSRSFTPKRLAALMDSTEAICAEVIDSMCEQGEVDLVSALSAPFPLLVICDMMGVPRSEFSTVLHATNTILSSGDPEYLGDQTFIDALLAAGNVLTELMVDLAEHRRRHPQNDLTTALVHADVQDDMLNPEEIGQFFILLVTAGNDTTRNAISLGMELLATYPDQRRHWQNHHTDVTGTAVEEIVRMASPVTFMRRTATEPTMIGDHAIEEGDRLVLFYGAANRDPDAFDDPELFDVQRHPNPHVGFGGPGPHFCLGAHLARREIAIAFRQLFTRLPDFEMAGPPTYLQATGIPLVGGVKHLPVRFTPQPPRQRLKA